MNPALILRFLWPLRAEVQSLTAEGRGLRSEG